VRSAVQLFRQTSLASSLRAAMSSHRHSENSAGLLFENVHAVANDRS